MTRLAALAVLLLAGCASAPQDTERSRTYGGNVACAACPAGHLTITLFPGGLAVLRWARPDAPEAARSELASWTQPAAERLSVRTTAGGRYDMAQAPARALTLVEAAGRPAGASLVPQPHPLNDAVRLSGLYAAVAGDAGWIAECASGKTLPVAERGQYLPLRAAYLDAVKQPGEPALAAVEARVIEEMIIGTQRLREVFVVTKLERITAGAACPR